MGSSYKRCTATYRKAGQNLEEEPHPCYKQQPKDDARSAKLSISFKAEKQTNKI